MAAPPPSPILRVCVDWKTPVNVVLLSVVALEEIHFGTDAAEVNHLLVRYKSQRGAAPGRVGGVGYGYERARGR